jgi:hypothetical protein
VSFSVVVFFLASEFVMSSRAVAPFILLGLSKARRSVRTLWSSSMSSKTGEEDTGTNRLKKLQHYCSPSRHVDLISLTWRTLSGLEGGRSLREGPTASTFGKKSIQFRPLGLLSSPELQCGKTTPSLGTFGLQDRKERDQKGMGKHSLLKTF